MEDQLYIQTGELDSAQYIGALAGHANIADYAASGLAINNVTPSEGVNGTIDISEGVAYRLLPEMFAPSPKPDGSATLKLVMLCAQVPVQNTVSLTTVGTNEVWVWCNLFDEGDGTREIHVTDADDLADTPPTSTDPTTGQVYSDYLKIAEVRPQQQQSDDPPQVTPFNRYPDAQYEDLETDDFAVNNTVTWQDGTVTYGPPLTVGAVLNNENTFYHRNDANPPGGEVHFAKIARIAEWATEADYADMAGEAENAEHSDRSTESRYLTYKGDRYDVDEIIERAASGVTGRGARIAYYEHRNPNKKFDFRLDIPNNYNQVTLRIQTENHGPDGRGNSLDFRLNRESGDRYVDAHYDYDFYGNLTEEDEIGSVRQPEFSVYYSAPSDYWRIARAPGQEVSVSEYTLTVPNAASQTPKNYPVMARTMHAVSPDIDNSFSHGTFLKDQTDLNHIRLFSDDGPDLTGKAAVYGRNTYAPPLFPDGSVEVVE
jgi:hypothetical protein